MAKNNQKEAAPQETQLTKFEEFFLKNKKVIGIAVAAVIAIVVAYLCYTNFVVEPRENKASTKVATAQASFDETLNMMGAAMDSLAVGNYQKALNGEKGKTAGFLQIIDEYGSTKAGNLSKLYAGICYANLGKYQEAEKYLADFDTKDDALVSPASQVALGDVYVNLKQLDKSVDAYKKAAKMADAASEVGHNDAISPVALLKAGKVLESQNKQADALEIYKEIKTKYVGAAAADEIDKYIERCTK